MSDEVIYGEPIEEREPTYREGYIQGIYRARNIIDSKQKETERLNTDKEQLTSLVNSCQEEIRKLKTQLQQKENIIKEVREYIESHTDKLKTIRIPKIDFNYKELLEILDKEKHNG